MSVSSEKSLPTIPLPWACVLVGILVTVMCYAIPQATWSTPVWDGFLAVGRIIGGSVAMVLTMDEFLTKSLLFGSWLSLLVYAVVNTYRSETSASTASIFFALLIVLLIMVVGSIMFSKPESPSRLMVYKEGAEQALFEPGIFSAFRDGFPAVDEKWISYYRCERVRKAYIEAGAPYHLRFDLQINGTLVADGVQCKRWDLNRVTLSRSRPV